MASSEIKLRNKSQFQNVSSHSMSDVDTNHTMSNLENGNNFSSHDTFLNDDPTDKNKKAVRNVMIISGLVMAW